MDLGFLGTQTGAHIVQVTASLENRSLVRHRYKDFTMTIRYLTAEDDVVDGNARISYQLLCPRTIESRIGGQERHFAYVTYLSADATFAWVQCEFTYVFTGIRS